MLATENKLVSRAEQIRAEQSRAVWIELLRVLACFCVILLHVSTKGWKYAGVDSSVWSIYEIFNSISRIGVCCFVMISGALFLGNSRGKDLGKIYKKYIFRIAVLTAFWSCAYFIFRILNGELKISGPKSTLGELLYGNYHLWYLWMIAGLYAITPILNRIIEDNKLCKYLLILCAVGCWIPGMLEIIPALSNLAQEVLQDKMYLFLPMGYTGYYILGYYLYRDKISNRRKHLLMLAGILGMLYGVIGGILYGRHIGEPSQATYNNLTLNIAFYSAMIFVLFKDKVGAICFTEKTKNIICNLGSATLGIYLVHVMFVQAFSDRFMVVTNYAYPFASFPIAILVFVCGYIVTCIVKKIPFVGKWII